MEYTNKYSLKRCLTEITKNWKQKLLYLYQIIRGLNDIHEKDLIHYNFHNGNILCNKYKEELYGIFISDYLGLYQLAKSFLKENDIYGVLPFIAPEILKGQPYTQASNIYSFSIIMWEFTSKILPFNDKAHDLQLALSICKGERPEIIENTPQCYIDLMKKCWDEDPLKRPSSKEVLNIIENWIFLSQNKEIEDISEELKSDIMEFINAPIEHNKLIVKSHPKACYTSHLLDLTSEELNEILEDSQGFLKSLKQKYQSSQNEFDYHSTKPKIKWISYSQIKSLKKIAEGGFGIIYKALINGDVVAIKKVLNSQEPNKYFLNELKSLYQCYDSKFEYIIKCHGITKDPITKEYMFIMKYANGGDLHNYLQENFAEITWKKKLHILWRISDGLQTIHKKNFVHRDFHSGNILVEIIENDSCKIDQYLIGDLGLSQPANDIHDSSIYGVIPYIAPEIFKGGKFSKSSDIYCMGMIMWELTSGRKPFANVEHDVDLIYKIIDGKRPNITDDTPEDFANLMKKCWNPDPKKRPSATHVCEIFNSWSNMEMVAEYFNQAEEIRLELIKSKMIGPDFNEKSHSKAIYTSRSLSSLTGSPSIITFNTKPNNKLIEESINNKEYITKEYEHDINKI
ncbi:kinase-like domain-containing protein [Rhizophagus irregularis DAOM 181602=DAOM 197198]|uniref:Kinase-like domain-containing protein n=2 Tax=Rhizophagus irregularis TaxID=588596 RepID=A0A2P4QVQ1_RHIID|nr:kinase-like domain-containing protein [Rhizophagus irregularis DAOM 181602=DAOM 197198]POG81705.1 kinase-like domain-containing protein [Rhizophagus irregularis DAOM 181602=DAOM 197198]|eukprot:XP_025188571.1 kinase-like domain-containing protein [Rhizophagus irregularis DAOM 181602=DAOM 197198]